MKIGGIIKTWLRFPRTSFSCKSLIFNFQFSIFILSPAHHAHALAFPDTSELKKTHKVSARSPDGKPTLFSRKHKGDSLSLALEWDGRRPVAARLEQGREFDPDAVETLTLEYGAGATWHEFDDGKRPYPGLVQQWYLKGYGTEGGWLGSGVHKARYFLVFRETPPSRLAKVEAPLALLPTVAAWLDTSSEWLKTPCREEDWGTRPDRPSGKSDGKAPDLPVCYRPEADSRMWVRITRLKPLALQARLEEEGSQSLAEIRATLQTVPDAAQADYAKDLSQMALGEAQVFLAKLSQRLPALFNWPSWQLQDSKEGQVPSEDFLKLVRSDRVPTEFLPALRLDGRKIRLAINLYYKGTFYLEAEAKP